MPSQLSPQPSEPPKLDAELAGHIREAVMVLNASISAAVEMGLIIELEVDHLIHNGVRDRRPEVGVKILRRF